MFEAYSITELDYELNQPVAFANIRYRDCRVNVTNGTTFSICTPGRYFVSFNGVGSSSAAATQFEVALFLNNEAVPAVRAEVTSTAADDPQNMSFTTIINVLPSNCYINNEANLQIRAVSETAGTLYSANLVIFRLK